MYRSYDVALLPFVLVGARKWLHMIPGGAALYSPNYTGPRTLEIEDVILFSGDGVAPLLNRPKAIITMHREAASSPHPEM